MPARMNSRCVFSIFSVMQQYLTLLKEVLSHGQIREDRTNTGTLSLFGRNLGCDLAQGFPLVTTKKVHFKSVVYELLWFLMGDTNVSYLNEKGVHIWDEWADEQGRLGPVYGKQWRQWPAADGKHLDQLACLVDNIKTKPYSRRHLLCSWNVSEIPKMALPPCHVLCQFYVEKQRLSCQVYQRSADIFLGLPFNIASYALLTHILAQVCNLDCGKLYFCLGDAHLYRNHVGQARLQLQREPLVLPHIQLNPSIHSVQDFTYQDIRLCGYRPHPAIVAPIAV